MGLSMEFYAGRPEDIGRAFTECNLEALRDGSLAHAYADLSLHLSADHLDLLSEEVAVALGRPPVILFESLEEHVGGTDGESSAEVVADAWVRLIAATPDALVPSVVHRWMAAVAREVGDPSITATADAERAVGALVRLCREAAQRRTRVVFGWYL